MTWSLVIGSVLAVTLLSGCAKRDMDECRNGDRSRCPGSASLTYWACRSNSQAA